MELTWFFDQWLHRPTNPALGGSWSYDSTARTLTVELTQSQAGAAYRLPLEIGISGDGSTAVRVEKIAMTQATQSWKIALDASPKEVTLDPNAWILMSVSSFVRK